MFLLKPLSLLADLVLLRLRSVEGVDRLVVADPVGGSALQTLPCPADGLVLALSGELWLTWSFLLLPPPVSCSLSFRSRPSLGSRLKRLASLVLVVGDRPELFFCSSSFRTAEPDSSQELSDLQEDDIQHRHR